MKKAIVWILVLTLCLSLCACAQKQDGAAANDGTTETKAPACNHSWKDATCTAAKTCTLCGATEGDVGGHTFTATCTVCGQENSDFVPLIEGSWTFLEEKDGRLTDGSFQFFRYENTGEDAVSIGYTFYKKLDQYAQEQNMTAEEAREEYAEMLKTVDGTEYVFDGWGMENSSDRRYKEENGVITIEFLSLDWDDNDQEVWNVASTVVLKRTGMAELTVTESSNSEVAVGLKITGKIEE